MNHYETVGVSPVASDDEIKKAYKKRAGKLHPDKQGGCTEDFQKLNHAYSVISDPERKALYDLTGDDTKPKNYKSEAGISLGQIFLRIISSDRKGNIVDMVMTEIVNSVTQAQENRDKVIGHVERFEKLLGRVVSVSEDNVCDNILESQVITLKKQLKAFDEFINIGGLMLDMLDDYSDSDPYVPKPDQNNYSTYPTYPTLKGSYR